MSLTEIILTVWFFISPLIILHLYMKLRGMRNFGEGMLEKLQDCWDTEYKNIIVQYGSTRNFLSLMTEDFKNVRNTGASYLGIFDATLEKINSEAEVKSTMTKADLINIINQIKLLSSYSLSESKDYLNYLVKEEELHDFEKKIEDAYKDIKSNFFDDFQMTVIRNDEDKNK